VAAAATAAAAAAAAACGHAALAGMISVAQRDAKTEAPTLAPNVGGLWTISCELSELPLWTPVQRGGTFHTSQWRHAVVTR
jgi:invasion protein IalB